MQSKEYIVATTGAGRLDRVNAKDALDILRILRAFSANDLISTLSLLCNNDIAGQLTKEALSLLPGLFGTVEARGSRLAAQAAFPEPEDVIAASCAALTRELLDLLNKENLIRPIPLD